MQKKKIDVWVDETFEQNILEEKTINVYFTC